MPELLIGPLLRYVGLHEATVWVEVDAPCRVSVLGATTRTFSCHGHHYALVVIEGLQPSTHYPYEVQLDDELVWPPIGATMPPPVIRTLSADEPAIVVFGSCRATAPHVPPYTLELDRDVRGRGVDAVRALGLRMLTQQPYEWPDLLMLLGDQVYADESSPSTANRVAMANRGPDSPPTDVVADFEQYTWLYSEAWRPDVERWVLSVVPSAMIFDDHDIIDDWNISDRWVKDIRRQPWWSKHIVGGLVSYWIYQHLGNMSPGRIREEGMLQAAVEAGDATELFERWAFDSERSTPVPGGYPFSYDRHLGTVHVVVIDVRNGRVLDPRNRQIVDEAEWQWVRDAALEPTEHLVVASSLPIFVPGGLHGIQQWNEALCAGDRGRLMRRFGEFLRRALDLEDWAAFDVSLRRFEQLLVDSATSPRPPHSITILSGDIHFGFVADVVLPGELRTSVRQVVCSPLRNVLRTRERRVMRFGASRVGRRVGAMLQRHARRGASTLSWDLSSDLIFHNNIGFLQPRNEDVTLRIDVAVLDGEGRETLTPAVVING